MALFDEIYKDMKNDVKIINEAVVYSDTDSNMSVFVKPSETRLSGRKAYFKVYNSAKHSSVTKVARVCFYEPKYVIHDNDMEGFDNWYLSSKEIKKLIRILNKNVKGVSVWKLLIAEYNRCCVNSNEMIDMNLSIPDYTNLKYKEVI